MRLKFWITLWMRWLAPLHEPTELFSLPCSASWVKQNNAKFLKKIVHQYLPRPLSEQISWYCSSKGTWTHELTSPSNSEFSERKVIGSSMDRGMVSWVFNVIIGALPSSLFANKKLVHRLAKRALQKLTTSSNYKQPSSSEG